MLYTRLVCDPDLFVKKFMHKKNRPFWGGFYTERTVINLLFYPAHKAVQD